MSEGARWSFLFAQAGTLSFRLFLFWSTPGLPLPAGVGGGHTSGSRSTSELLSGLFDADIAGGVDRSFSSFSSS